MNSHFLFQLLSHIINGLPYTIISDERTLPCFLYMTMKPFSTTEENDLKTEPYPVEIGLIMDLIEVFLIIGDSIPNIQNQK